jgi:hypothetical protein
MAEDKKKRGKSMKAGGKPSKLMGPIMRSAKKCLIRQAKMGGPSVLP